MKIEGMDLEESYMSSTVSSKRDHIRDAVPPIQQSAVPESNILSAQTSIRHEVKLSNENSKDSSQTRVVHMKKYGAIPNTSRGIDGEYIIEEEFKID